MEPISRIDPSTNQLYFRGINAIDLARTADFESVLFLLVNGDLPTNSQRKKLIHRMNQLRKLYTDDIQSLNALIYRLASLRKEHNLNLHDTLLTFVTLCPFVVAKQITKAQNLEMEKQDDNLNHSTNFLWMVMGISQLACDAEDLQTALILPMDDPDNPSLTALIQGLETGNTMEALVAALKAHVGPLHHGAGALAMSMFEEIETPERARKYLEERLEAGNKIYGLGHRIYRGIDPRAVVLREMLERRIMGSDDEWLLHVAQAVVKEGSTLLATRKGIDTYPNIDLYNAAVYYSLGFPHEFNTSLFAISRAAGWMAHILDFRLK
jgi:citrate synthase